MRFRDRLNKEIKENPGFKELFDREKAILELAMQITAARQDMGLTQSQLAKKAHISQQQLSKIERGQFGNFKTVMNVIQSLDKKIILSE